MPYLLWPCTACKRVNALVLEGLTEEEKSSEEVAAAAVSQRCPWDCPCDYRRRCGACGACRVFRVPDAAKEPETHQFKDLLQKASVREEVEGTLMGHRCHQTNLYEVVDTLGYRRWRRVISAADDTQTAAIFAEIKILNNMPPASLAYTLETNPVTYLPRMQIFLRDYRKPSEGRAVFFVNHPYFERGATLFPSEDELMAFTTRCMECYDAVTRWSADHIVAHTSLTVASLVVSNASPAPAGGSPFSPNLTQCNVRLADIHLCVTDYEGSGERCKYIRVLGHALLLLCEARRAAQQRIPVELLVSAGDMISGKCDFDAFRRTAWWRACARMGVEQHPTLLQAEEASRRRICEEESAAHHTVLVREQSRITSIVRGSRRGSCLDTPQHHAPRPADPSSAQPDDGDDASSPGPSQRGPPLTCFRRDPSSDITRTSLTLSSVSAALFGISSSSSGGAVGIGGTQRALRDVPFEVVKAMPAAVQPGALHRGVSYCAEGGTVCVWAAQGLAVYRVFLKQAQTCVQAADLFVGKPLQSVAAVPGAPWVVAAVAPPPPPAAAEEERGAPPSIPPHPSARTLHAFHVPELHSALRPRFGGAAPAPSPATPPTAATAAAEEDLPRAAEPGASIDLLDHIPPEGNSALRGAVASGARPMRVVSMEARGSCLLVCTTVAVFTLHFAARGSQPPEVVCRAVAPHPADPTPGFLAASFAVRSGGGGGAGPHRSFLLLATSLPSASGGFTLKCFGGSRDAALSTTTPSSSADTPPPPPECFREALDSFTIPAAEVPAPTPAAAAPSAAEAHTASGFGDADGPPPEADISGLLFSPTGSHLAVIQRGSGLVPAARAVVLRCDALSDACPPPASGAVSRATPSGILSFGFDHQTFSLAVRGADIVRLLQLPLPATPNSRRAPEGPPGAPALSHLGQVAAAPQASESRYTLNEVLSSGLPSSSSRQETPVLLLGVPKRHEGGAALLCLRGAERDGKRWAGGVQHSTAISLRLCGSAVLGCGELAPAPPRQSAAISADFEVGCGECGGVGKNSEGPTGSVRLPSTLCQESRTLRPIARYLGGLAVGLSGFYADSVEYDSESQRHTVMAKRIPGSGGGGGDGYTIRISCADGAVGPVEEALGKKPSVPQEKAGAAQGDVQAEQAAPAAGWGLWGWGKAA